MSSSRIRTMSTKTRARVLKVRRVALLCACLFGIGSHFGQHILGPLKSQLSREKGTSNAMFGLLVTAFGLNSTWTPLVGGIFAARFGTSASSIIATSLILIGQVILLLGDLGGSVKVMVIGMFIFGLGISPLSVVQETIIVQHYNNHGLGLALALGLVVGKSSSFLSARISYPLSEWNPHAPFFAATFLAAFSFLVNVFYIWYIRGTAAELEGSEEDHLKPITEEQALHMVTQKKRVHIMDLMSMGDVFWVYIAINFFCGTIWSPFPHLAPNIIEHRYKLSEGSAAEQASMLLAGSVILYPICGYLTDIVKKRSIIHRLLMLSSLLTIMCYTWLVLLPNATHTALPAMLSFGVGYGFSPLLLVVIVPHLVPLQHVSTALGAHKSIESSGSSMMQTISGLVLDAKSRTPQKSTDVQSVLNAFLALNIVQFFGIYVMMTFDRIRQSQSTRPIDEYRSLTTDEPAAEELELHESASTTTSSPLNGDHIRAPESPSRLLLHTFDIISLSERTRGKSFFILAALTILSTWILFFVCAGLEFK